MSPHTILPTNAMIVWTKKVTVDTSADGIGVESKDLAATKALESALVAPMTFVIYPDSYGEVSLNGISHEEGVQVSGGPKPEQKG